MSTSQDDFAKLYVGIQPRLFAFIASLVGSHDVANDLLQETNLVIWEKREEFTLGTNFTAWAFQIARFKVLRMRQKIASERLVFSGEFVDLIADESTHFYQDFDLQQAALEQCISRLSPAHRELIKQRYLHSRSVMDLAREFGRRANSIAVQLYRVRCALADCIDRRIKKSREGML